MRLIYEILHSSKGATAIEYGLIAALISVAAISAMGRLSTGVKTTFNTAGSSMTAVAN